MAQPDDQHYANTQPLTFEGIRKASIITNLPTHWCSTGISAPVVMSLPPGELAPGWQVKQTIPLTVERDEDGLWLLSDALFLCYGAGESLTEALQDYALDLLSYAEVVEKYAEKGYA